MKAPQSIARYYRQHVQSVLGSIAESLQYATSRPPDEAAAIISGDIKRLASLSKEFSAEQKGTE